MKSQKNQKKMQQNNLPYFPIILEIANGGTTMVNIRGRVGKIIYRSICLEIDSLVFLTQKKIVFVSCAVFLNL